MRADITASLLHNPAVLYLDEPTIGLDVVAKQQMRDAIKSLNKEFNTTVILTTHDLDDIEELCHRIIMIDKGKIIYEGTLRDIKDTYGYMKTVTFECSGDIKIDLSTLKMKEEDLHYSIEDLKLTIHYNKHKVSVSDIASIVMEQNNVMDMSVQEQDIEVLVGNIYQRGV
jgi:ABC-2 type transport system ATP-binding protein